jgi:hypothetical protein
MAHGTCPPPDGSLALIRASLLTFKKKETKHHCSRSKVWGIDAIWSSCASPSAVGGADLESTANEVQN